MGLFSRKQTDNRSAEEVDDTGVLSDPKYREELREAGRQQFKKLIDEQSGHLEKEVDTMLEKVAVDLKTHTGRRIDALMGRLNAEVTNQLNDRLKEYNQVSGEAQELVAQSLSRNAQMVHEKYQQLSLNMQRSVADQE